MNKVLKTLSLSNDKETYFTSKVKEQREKCRYWLYTSQSEFYTTKVTDSLEMTTITNCDV